jgi:hypothetical protein
LRRVVVKFINTDGLAFIGPGSEWFWTAMSGLVLAVTFVAIYRQLRLQRAATTFQQANELVHEWEAERMLRARLAVLEAVRESRDPATLPETSAAEIADYWERVGNLVAAGHVDPAQVRGNACRIWWGRLQTFARMARERFEDHEVFTHFERLAERYAREDRRAGVTAGYDDAYLARILPSSIQNVESALRLAEELRATIVRPPSAPEPVVRAK